MTCRLLLLVAALVAALATPSFADDKPRAAESWEPAKTYGVVVGVLQYDKGSWVQPISISNRKDKEFHDLLVTRGVPKGNLRLMLDKDATQKAIGEFGKDKYGEALFVPDAGKSEAEVGL